MMMTTRRRRWPGVVSLPTLFALALATGCGRTDAPTADAEPARRSRAKTLADAVASAAARGHDRPARRHVRGGDHAPAPGRPPRGGLPQDDHRRPQGRGRAVDPGGRRGRGRRPYRLGGEPDRRPRGPAARERRPATPPHDRGPRRHQLRRRPGADRERHQRRQSLRHRRQRRPRQRRRQLHPGGELQPRAQRPVGRGDARLQQLHRRQPTGRLPRRRRPGGSASTTTSISPSSSARWPARSAARRWATGRR